MAYVFQTINKASGKPHPKWRFQYTDYRGVRRTGTGLTSRIETEKLANKVESEHDEIRKGYRPAPSQADRRKNESFSSVAAEYLAWGRSQGGRGGRPWGAVHERKRTSLLAWWERELELEVIGDLNNSLDKAERRLRGLQQGARSGKTLQHYAETLHSFCVWCVTRGYLSENPVKNLKSFDITPRSMRRSVTPEEISKLLAVAPLQRRLLYETAFCTGLRAGELRSLTINDLNISGAALKLRAEWTKNRKDGVQPLPIQLAAALAENARAGGPQKHYEEFYAKSNVSAKAPEDVLLYVPSHPSRELDKDLVAAGIPKKTDEGKLDFHACRVAYVTLVLEAGATAKEAQSLARHSNPSLTMNIYARARKGRLVEISQRVGDAILPRANTTGAEWKFSNSITPCDAGRWMVEAGGVEPPS